MSLILETLDVTPPGIEWRAPRRPRARLPEPAVVASIDAFFAGEKSLARVICDLQAAGTSDMIVGGFIRAALEDLRR